MADNSVAVLEAGADQNDAVFCQGGNDPVWDTSTSVLSDERGIEDAEPQIVTPAPKKRGRKKRLVAILEEMQTPAPSKEFLEAVSQERRSTSSFPGSLPHPNARGAATLPARKGNRRHGAARVSNKQHPGRNLPAKEDPIILRRRAIAMPYWNRGYNAPEVMAQVNTWLHAEGLEPVSIHTIRDDKLAIVREWEADYDRSSGINRQQHISALNRMKSEAWLSYEAMKATGRASTAAAQFLKIAADIEVDLAKLDGSAKRAEVQAASDVEESRQTKFTRMYVGVDISDLEQDDAQPVIVQGHNQHRLEDKRDHTD